MIFSELFFQGVLAKNEAVYFFILLMQRTNAEYE